MKLYGVAYDHEICRFGTQVLWKSVRGVGKFEKRWERGVWVGRDYGNGAHLVLTSQGVQRARCVRQLEAAEAFSSDFLRYSVHAKFH